jgi:hypothetical protein
MIRTAESAGGTAGVGAGADESSGARSTGAEDPDAIASITQRLIETATATFSGPSEQQKAALVHQKAAPAHPPFANIETLEEQQQQELEEQRQRWQQLEAQADEGTAITAVQSAMHFFASALFRFLYATAPWQVLRFLRSECNPSSSHGGTPRHHTRRRRRLRRETVAALLQEVRLHPGILLTTREELNMEDWTDLPPLKVEERISRYDLPPAIEADKSDKSATDPSAASVAEAAEENGEAGAGEAKEIKKQNSEHERATAKEMEGEVDLAALYALYSTIERAMLQTGGSKAAAAALAAGVASASATTAEVVLPGAGGSDGAGGTDATRMRTQSGADGKSGESAGDATGSGGINNVSLKRTPPNSRVRALPSVVFPSPVAVSPAASSRAQTPSRSPVQQSQEGAAQQQLAAQEPPHQACQYLYLHGLKASVEMLVERRRRQVAEEQLRRALQLVHAHEARAAEVEELGLEAHEHRLQRMRAERQAAVNRAEVVELKKEQQRWGAQLRLKVSKYASERKRVSEHNIVLGARFASVEDDLKLTQDKLAIAERELTLKAATMAQVEGRERERARKAIRGAEARAEGWMRQAMAELQATNNTTTNNTSAEATQGQEHGGGQRQEQQEEEEQEEQQNQKPTTPLKPPFHPTPTLISLPPSPGAQQESGCDTYTSTSSSGSSRMSSSRTSTPRDSGYDSCEEDKELTIQRLRQELASARREIGMREAKEAAGDKVVSNTGAAETETEQERGCDTSTSTSTSSSPAVTPLSSYRSFGSGSEEGGELSKRGQQPQRQQQLHLMQSSLEKEQQASSSLRLMIQRQRQAYDDRLKVAEHRYGGVRASNMALESQVMAMALAQERAQWEMQQLRRRHGGSTFESENNARGMGDAIVGRGMGDAMGGGGMGDAICGRGMGDAMGGGGMGDAMGGRGMGDAIVGRGMGDAIGGGGMDDAMGGGGMGDAIVGRGMGDAMGGRGMGDVGMGVGDEYGEDEGQPIPLPVECGDAVYYISPNPTGGEGAHDEQRRVTNPNAANDGSRQRSHLSGIAAGAAAAAAAASTGISSSGSSGENEAVATDGFRRKTMIKVRRGVAVEERRAEAWHSRQPSDEQSREKHSSNRYSSGTGGGVGLGGSSGGSSGEQVDGAGFRSKADAEARARSLSSNATMQGVHTAQSRIGHRAAASAKRGGGSRGGAASRAEYGAFSAFVSKDVPKGAPTAQDRQATAHSGGAGLLNNTWAGIGVVHEEHFETEPEQEEAAVMLFEKEYELEHGSRSAGTDTAFSRSRDTAFSRSGGAVVAMNHRAGVGDGRKLKRVRSASDHTSAMKEALRGRAQGGEAQSTAGGSFFKRLTNNFGLR